MLDGRLGLFRFGLGQLRTCCSELCLVLAAARHTLGIVMQKDVELIRKKSNVSDLRLSVNMRY